jgi:NitT/TauT family transport system substrate-binding protein
VQNETVRVNAVNANCLDAHRSAVLGFLKAYKKSIDWAFSGEPAIAAYAKLFDQHFDVAKYIVKEFSSKATAQLDEIKGEDRALAEALAAKRIYESAIVSRFVFSREIRRSATFGFCNMG